MIAYCQSCIQVWLRQINWTALPSVETLDPKLAVWNLMLNGYIRTTPSSYLPELAPLRSRRKPVGDATTTIIRTQALSCCLSLMASVNYVLDMFFSASLIQKHSSQAMAVLCACIDIGFEVGLYVNQHPIVDLDIKRRRGC